MKIYVASSWRNSRQPAIVKLLREEGHEVYDFRNPAEADSGFHWGEIDPRWKEWSPAQFVTGLDHYLAEEGFQKDMEAMLWADAFVLVMPCGRSAHLEAGWALGTGKPTAILLESADPELMYKMATELCLDTDGLLRFLAEIAP